MARFPGGTIRRDEPPEEAVRRELREETGLVATEVEYLFIFSGLDKRHHVYWANVNTTVGALPGNDIADCGWMEVPLDAVLSTKLPTREIVGLWYAAQTCARVASYCSFPLDRPVNVCATINDSQMRGYDLWKKSLDISSRLSREPEVARSHRGGPAHTKFIKSRTGVSGTAIACSARHDEEEPMFSDVLPARPAKANCLQDEGTVTGRSVRRVWRLTKHHSLSPKQYAFANVLLCFAPLFAAVFVHACTGSLSCYGLGVLNLGIIWGAYFCYAIHADDGEFVELSGHTLVITRVHGRTTDTVQVNTIGQALNRQRPETGLVKITHCGTPITVGREASLACRRIFAAELAVALRSARQATPDM
jgi:8-oxo-dGTP diphosphatase